MRYYSAIVKDSDDPDKRGRIKAEIPALLDGQWHDWIDVWAPLGLAGVWVPRVDDVVIVARQDGGALRWLGGTLEGSSRAWPDPFRKDYGQRHGVASADGAACLVLVSGGGVLLLAGPQGTITLATGEDARVEPLVLGQTFGQAWDDFLTAFTTFLGSISAAAVEPTLAPAVATLQPQIAALSRAASFKSSKVSTE